MFEFLTAIDIRKMKQLIINVLTNCHDTIIGEFMAGLAFKRSPTEFEEHLKKFLTCLKIIRGSFADASSVLQDEWTEIFQKELSLQVNLKMS